VFSEEGLDARAVLCLEGAGYCDFTSACTIRSGYFRPVRCDAGSRVLREWRLWLRWPPDFTTGAVMRPGSFEVSERAPQCQVLFLFRFARFGRGSKLPALEDELETKRQASRKSSFRSEREIFANRTSTVG
jgi:hypothetical protein